MFMAQTKIQKSEINRILSLNKKYEEKMIQMDEIFNLKAYKDYFKTIVNAHLFYYDLSTKISFF